MSAASRHVPLAAAAVAVAGAAIAAYLTLVKLGGELPACGPLHGCETVALSAYSEVLGVPLAAFGLGLSAVVAALDLAWWRGGDRRAAVAAYGLGLAAVVVVCYLTFLEVFVIGAICAWCVGYAATVVVGWLLTTIGMRSG